MGQTGKAVPVVSHSSGLGRLTFPLLSWYRESLPSPGTTGTVAEVMLGWGQALVLWYWLNRGYDGMS